LFFFLHRTKLGLSMRAAAANPVSSGLAGVDAGRIYMVGWGLAALLSGLSGILIAPRLFLDNNMMLSVIIYSFAAAALGGFHSLGGVIVGGLLVGLAETLAGNYVEAIGADFRILVPLGLLLAVLLLKPSGLFGGAAERKA
jgi:branched-chain amino acid transport system permease protein